MKAADRPILKRKYITLNVHIRRFFNFKRLKINYLSINCKVKSKTIISKETERKYSKEIKINLSLFADK